MKIEFSTENTLEDGSLKVNIVVEFKEETKIRYGLQESGIVVIIKDKKIKEMILTNLDENKRSVLLTKDEELKIENYLERKGIIQHD